MSTRGKHPGDDELFGPAWREPLRRAVFDQSWLLTRGYNETAALKLVGDRHGLTRRQRKAVSRCACSDAALRCRLARRVPPGALRGRPVAVDGLNLLITLETALAGGVVLVGRDGGCRDLAGVHGSYGRVGQTVAGAEAAGRTLAGLAAGPVTWHLDRPVAHSGELRGLLEEVAREHGWGWRVELHADPDPVLAAAEAVVASSDGWVLDRCGPWCDLAGEVLRRRVPGAWLLDLGG